MNRDQIAQNLAKVRQQIADAAARAGRAASDITLVAVTKQAPTSWIRALANEGVFDWGENYPQSLFGKVQDPLLADLTQARWHHIGHLQSNKAKRVFPLVRWIHGVDSLKLLQFLNAIALESPQHNNVPSICLQVNTSGEPSKHGWTPQSILEDADAIVQCQALPICGLMTMAALGSVESDGARPFFAKLRSLRDQFKTRTSWELPHLSMGMSGDFEVAIEEGATLVRVGSALFEGVGESSS